MSMNSHHELSLQHVSIDGINTRYISGGVGEDTIVFISNGVYSESGFCWNLFSWERNLGVLAEHFRVVAFDTLGQGGTDAPTGEIRFTYDLVVEHARRFLEVLGIKQAHIVGHDQGALIGLHLAFGEDNLVRSCTLVDTPTTIAPPGDDLTKFLEWRLPQPAYGAASQAWILDQLSYSHEHVGSGTFLNDAVRKASAPGFADSLPSVDQLYRELKPSLRRARGECYKKIREHGVPVPTLLVWGYNDPACPLPCGRALFDFLAPRQAQTQLRVINKAGFFPFREQPDVFNRHIAGFARAVSRKRIGATE